MDSSTVALLTDRFASLQDPRTGRAKRHEFMDVIVIAICAVICGSDSWVDVEMFGKAKKDWLSHLLELPNGIPSHDTFGRIFARLDPVQFEACFTEWVQAVNEVMQGQVVAIDGKTIRRSHDRRADKSAIHMVSAWASANRLVLGQIKVDDHSNEITAIPELLKTLDVSGCTVTIDAMGCQKEIAATVTEQGADYVLALKQNQPQLYDDVTEMFDHAKRSGFSDLSHRFSETVGKGHGRIEKRRCWAVSDPDHLDYVNDHNQWSGLKSLAMVESERTENGKTSTQTRYYISSLPNDVRMLLSSVRTHWGIENSVHWVLDVAFGEDNSRVRQGNAAENLSVLRRMALNMLKQETTSQGGVAAKRKRAGWDEDYLLLVLAN